MSGERTEPLREPPPEPPPASTLAGRLAPVVLVVGSFVLYLANRTRYVGGCDTWSYLAQSMRMRGAGLEMSGPPSPTEHEALLPLCHALVDGEARSFFPPGYPALLALDGLLDQPFLVNPLLGALGVGLVYAWLVRRTGVGIASIIAALWATAPLVVWGSVRPMSDLPATVLLLGAALAVERARATAGGAALGFSLAVRPVSLLFGVAVVPQVLARRAGVRFALGVALGVLPWLVYLLATVGLPWEAPYVRTNAPEVGLHGNYLSQLGFLLQTTLQQHPGVVALAALALYHRSAGARSLALTFAAFVAFYALWRTDYEAWWQSRFILPGFAALYLMAGLGLAELRDQPEWAQLRRVPVGLAMGAVLLLALLGLRIHRAHAYQLFDPDFDRRYATDSRRVAALTSERSLVAAVNFTGPLRLYGERTSFMWNHPDAGALIDDALEEPRPVYAVIEPWDLPRLRARRPWRMRYELVEIAPLSLWGELQLHRVLPREMRPDRAPTAELEVVDSRGLAGPPRPIVDRRWPPPGSPWDGPGAVVLQDAEAHVTVRVPDGFEAGSVRVVADGNDAYRIEGSLDGERFEHVLDIANPAQPGLRPRWAPLPRGAPARFLRLRPTAGDGLFSVAELEVQEALPRAVVTDAHGIERGRGEQLVDGRFPAEGSPWDAADTVGIREDGSVTLRLPPGGPVSALSISADGNDRYRVEGSTDGERWERIDAVPDTGLPGMRRRTITLDGRWELVRISPESGDGFYALGEIAPVVERGRVFVDLAAAPAWDGWHVEQSEAGRASLRPTRDRAHLRPIELQTGAPQRVILSIAHGPDVPPDASATFSFNGARLERHRLNREAGTYHLVVPARLVRESNVLTMELDPVASAHRDAIELRRVTFQRAVGPRR